jgi:hypothetical protein
MTSDEPTEPTEPGNLPPPEYRNRAIAALAANVGIVLFCSPAIGIVGALLAGIGLALVTSRPESARVFIRWAWIAVGVAVVVVTILNIWFVATQDEEAVLTVVATTRYA